MLGAKAVRFAALHSACARQNAERAHKLIDERRTAQSLPATVMRMSTYGCKEQHLAALQD